MFKSQVYPEISTPQIETFLACYLQINFVFMLVFLKWNAWLLYWFLKWWFSFWQTVCLSWILCFWLFCRYDFFLPNDASHCLFYLKRYFFFQLMFVPLFGVICSWIRLESYHSRDKWLYFVMKPFGVLYLGWMFL